ncbi:MAG: hypothetical protein IJU78_06310 [Clostridia bacterium]|nr:hypothetical protein [Clostridia bacterium]
MGFVRGALRAISLLLCILLAAAVVWLSFWGDSMLPSGFRYGLYAANIRVESDGIPQSDGIITDRRAPVKQGHYIIYRETEGRPLAPEDSRLELRLRHVLARADGELPDGAEEAIYRVRGLAAAANFLSARKYIACLSAAAAVGAVVLFAVTGRRGKLKRERAQLRERFEFYGQKYEQEDAGKDY